MRTFLACSGILGQESALDKLDELVRGRNPDAILFAGGLFAACPSDESPSAAAKRRHRDMQLLEHFFAALGATRTVAAVVPGPSDAPLRAFLMACPVPTATTRTSMPLRSVNTGRMWSNRPLFWVDVVDCTTMNSPLAPAGIGVVAVSAAAARAAARARRRLRINGLSRLARVDCAA